MTADSPAPPRAADRIRLLVVDNHRTFTDLLQLALADANDLDCVGAAHSLDEADEMSRALRPDVVLIDFQLGPSNSLGLVAELTSEFPELRVVVLTAVADRQVMRAASAAGACGLLTKTGSLDEVLDAVRTAPRSGFSVSPPLLQELITTPDTTRQPNRLSTLTVRELQVLRLLAAGQDARRISTTLGLTLNTCRGYIKNILAKLHVHSQLQAVSVAIRDGLIDVPPNRAR
jgi:DNA-binding NarL/FixJ family response regulator